MMPRGIQKNNAPSVYGSGVFGHPGGLRDAPVMTYTKLAQACLVKFRAETVRAAQRITDGGHGVGLHSRWHERSPASRCDGAQPCRLGSFSNLRNLKFSRVLEQFVTPACFFSNSR